MGALATAGVVDTAYLTITKLLLNQNPSCPVHGCEDVLNSPYANVFGLPLSLWGLLAYFTMAALALGPLLLKSVSKSSQLEQIEHWTALFLFIGATAMASFSGCLMYVLATQLHAFCPYCIFSAVLSLSLFTVVVLGRDWVDRGQLMFIGIMVVIITLLGTLAMYSPIARQVKGPAEVDRPISQNIIDSLKQASQQGLTVQDNSLKVLLRAIPPSSRPNNGGPPEVTYIGADYCPYCASLRWSLALTLLRFGELKDVKYMLSSHNDAFPDTPTLSFYQSNYQSKYIKFTGLELQDREGKPLQQPTDEQKNLLSTFDIAPYTDSPGAIPFLYLGGRYVQTGAPVSPELFQKLTWEQVTEQLKNPNSPISKPVLANTNLLTAAVCQVAPQAPKDVCQAPGVVAAAAKLPH